MASTRIEIPDFDFTSFYYPQILEALIRYKRVNVPELTDESEYEPAIQMLRAFALVGHLNNTLIDLVANESMLPTATLVESVRNHLRLIGYEMSPATPAVTEVVYELARVFAVATEVVPEGAQVATQRSGAEVARVYEVSEALTIEPSNAFGAVRVQEGGVFTDRTAAANDPDPGLDFAVWAAPEIGDAICFGHANVMWSVLALTLASPGSGYSGVWEVYDGDWLKDQPDDVSQVGATLRVTLNALLGASARPGTMVRVTLNSNATYEDALSQWDGVDNFVEVGLLGQSSPSVDSEDYTVGSDWSEVGGVDGTSGFTASGNLEYILPQTTEMNWTQTTLDGFLGYWLRFRITAVAAPSAPELNRARMDTGAQAVIRLVTQGQVGADDPLGSSTGLPDQLFRTSRDYYIPGTMVVTVEGEEWAEVDNFLNSAPADKHYVVVLGENDRASVSFGSGNAGKVPPVGVNNISAVYRWGANVDGNVGPNTITIDKTGLTYINGLYNPRQASGWQEAEGANEASLERAKIAGPTSLRTRSVALGPDDVAEMAKNYVTAAGAKPFGRAIAIEEGLGPKTIELIVVKKGGGLATADELAELDLYFNGDKYATPPLPKRVVANQEVTSFNYTPRVIDITATVEASGVEAQEIVNRLLQVIQPEALKADGITYEWQFGDKVNISRVSHEVFETDEDRVEDVDLVTPASNITLGSRELPVAGTINITIV